MTLWEKEANWSHLRMSDSRTNGRQTVWYSMWGISSSYCQHWRQRHITHKRSPSLPHSERKGVRGWYLGHRMCGLSDQSNWNSPESSEMALSLWKIRPQYVFKVNYRHLLNLCEQIMMCNVTELWNFLLDRDFYAST